MLNLGLTLLDGNRTNIAHVIFHAHQLITLGVPKRLLVGVGQATKELQPEGEELALVGVVQTTCALASIGLVRVVDRQRLVSNGSNSTDLAITFVEDLAIID